MRVLVTGAAGFTGTQMIKFLSLQEGVTVSGLLRKIPPVAILGNPKASFLVADVLDLTTLFTTVAGFRPDAIIHLAGLTRGTLDGLLLANVVGTKNILEAGYAANPDCRTLVVSSSSVYGYPGTRTITESTPLQPLSEYGISKMAQDALALMYAKISDYPACVARPFNLAGPGQSDSFVCSRIVKQITEIEQERRPALELLETTSSRDLIDVRDVVRGYWALVTHPEFSHDCAGKAFNLGSGNAFRISKIISLIEEVTGRQYEVKVAANRDQVPIPSQQSDNSRITKLTGWKPEIPLIDTLRDMLTASQGNSVE